MFLPSAWTRPSSAQSRGDFQETVIVKNPNHSNRLPLATWGEVPVI